MASLLKSPLILFVSSLLLHAALADIICEDLATDVCAFSISSSGKRCVLETETMSNGGVEYQCRTSEVVVGSMTNYIESDECVHACGVDRRFVGISSDALLEPEFTAKLCSPECLNKCPNLVDLYSNLAAGEGAFLPDVCAARRNNPHRWMFEIMSSGAAASLVGAPAPAPM